MIVTAPYWLLAASAILIPIAIHLWNKRQGKTVKVGSIRWLEASASKQWSRIRLTDVWLLLLRCAIIILLAVALAKPFIEVGAGNEKEEKAVFISPEILYSDAITTLKPTIEPLLLRGYTLHTFDPTFTEISPEQWQQLSGNPTDSVVENGNYWQLMPALAQAYNQPQDSVLLFTSDQQRHFTGPPSPLQENIKWVPVAFNKATNWLQDAYQTAGGDSVLLITGESTTFGTRFKNFRIAGRVGNQQQASALQVRLTQQKDSLWAYWGITNQHRIPVRQEPIRIGIVADKEQQTEVKYLQTALKVISGYTGIPVAFQSDSAGVSDWLFWLSDAEVPDTVKALVESGMQLWLQPRINPEVTNASLSLPVQNVQLHQLSSGKYNSENIIWSATNGDPVLTSEQKGKGSVYSFRSGFSPEWSKLGQGAQLPDLLFPLLFTTGQTAKYNATALPEKLLTPARTAVKPAKALEAQPYNLLPWLVVAAFALFLIERFISSKRVMV